MFSVLKDILNSVRFLTVFRFKKNQKQFQGKSAFVESLQKSIKFFPLAGLFVGVVLAGVFFIFSRFLPVPASVMLSIASLFIVTGGLHFDGLSDTADGFLAYLKTGERKRFHAAIKDTYTGFAGVAAILFYILIIWVILSGGGLKFACFSLLSFPVAGRYSVVVLSYFLNTPEDFRGIGTVFTEGTDLLSFIVASILAGVIIFLLLGFAGFFSLLISIFFIIFLGLYFSKRFGGVNGDMLGFGVKTSEVVYMIALVGFYKIIA